ncbi:hypothetical protein ACISRB_10790, partial [Micromonospora aurantiaca]
MGGHERGLHRRRRSRSGRFLAVVLVGAVLAAGGYAARHPDLLDRIEVRGTVPAAAPSAPPAGARATPTPVPAAGRVAPGIGYPA